MRVVSLRGEREKREEDQLEWVRISATEGNEVDRLCIDRVE